MFAALILALTAVIGGGTAALAKKDGPPPIIQQGSEVEVQLLALNDFHGNIHAAGRLQRPRRHRERRRRRVPRDAHARTSRRTANTFVVSAGDLIGASPLLSALFHDEPTIEAMNMIGLDLNAVGNHEFDEGTTELLRMQNGGCHPVDGCQDGDGFAGADFKFLAANVVNHDTAQTLFPPYAIEHFSGAKIAFIGMTLEGTPNIVSPSGVAGFDFLDEADTANALIKKIKETTDAIVVLIHEGGSPTALDINGCAGVTGADRRHRRATRRRGRPDRLRSHAPAVQLRVRRQARDERVLVRAAHHRHRHEGRQAQAGRHVDRDQQQDRDPGRRRRRGASPR